MFVINILDIIWQHFQQIFLTVCHFDTGLIADHDFSAKMYITVHGKTGKTAVLPGFCKLEQGSDSGCTPLYYGGLTLIMCLQHAGGIEAVHCLNFVYFSSNI